MMKRRIEAHVVGKVQGVFYRDFVWRKAKSLDLVGETYNETDGSVKIIAEGDIDKLKIFLDHLKHGPPHARVDDLEFSWSARTQEFQDFKIQ